jgi:hypothetical protein
LTLLGIVVAKWLLEIIKNFSLQSTFRFQHGFHEVSLEIWVFLFVLGLRDSIDYRGLFRRTPWIEKASERSGGGDVLGEKCQKGVRGFGRALLSQPVLAIGYASAPDIVGKFLQHGYDFRFPAPVAPNPKDRRRQRFAFPDKSVGVVLAEGAIPF